MVEKRALNPDAVRSNPTHRKKLIHPTTFEANNHTLENLNPFAITFDNAHVNVNRITGEKVWVLTLLLFNGLMFNRLD
jgi:hypothetical protein